MANSPLTQVPNTDSIQLTITSPLIFRKAAVTSLSSVFGFNSSPSTVNISIVNDPQISTVGFIETGGIGYGNTPGVFAYIEIDNSNDNFDNFSFGGIIQSWSKNTGISGTTYDVNLADPRILFTGIPVITSLNSLGTSTNNNIIDFLGYYDGNIIEAGWTPYGFKWSKFKNLLLNWTGRFYNVDYKFAFDVSFDVRNDYLVDVQDTTLDALLSDVVSKNGLDYYIKATPVYLTTGDPLALPGDQILSYVLITFYGINRRTQIGGDELLNDELEYFLTTNADTLISHTYGRELRTDPNNVVIWGEKKHEIYSNTGNGTNHDYDPIPIYNQFADGNITDRPFINLEGLVFGDFTNYANLPDWPFEARSLTVSNVTIGQDPQYTKQRLLRWTPGYFVDEYILRAALVSQESWETAVWYTYKDLVRRRRLLNNILAVDSFDMYPLNLGDHVPWLFNSNDTPKTLWDLVLEGTFGYNMAFVPEKLGIYVPPYNRASPDTIFNINMALADTPDDVKKFREQLKEAVFQETLKVANEYYGKKFIVRLPNSDIIDTLKANGNNSNLTYDYLSKRHEIEYAVADGAWVEPDQVPYIIKNNENNLFQLPDGRYKPIVLIDIDHIRNYNDNWINWTMTPQEVDREYAYLPAFGTLVYSEIYDNEEFYPTYFNFDNHDVNTFVKVSKNDDGQTAPSTLALESNIFVYKGDVDVEQYTFDPRFALITISQHINIGHSFIRYFDEDVMPSPDIYFTIDPPPDEDVLTKVKVTDHESKEFISWLYQYHIPLFPKDVLYDQYLADKSVYDYPINGNEYSSGYIDAQTYYDWINKGSVIQYEGRFGLAPRRLCRIDFQYRDGDPSIYSRQRLFEYKVPLVWNFIRYGPFTDSLSETCNTQVVIDTGLTPWAYGSTENMNNYGLNQVLAAESNNKVLNTAQITLAGYPILNLGDPLGINANVTNIGLSYGVDGVKTTYSFKTFVGSPALLKKNEKDLQNQLKVGEIGFSSNRLDAPFREFLKTNKKLRDTVFNVPAVKPIKSAVAKSGSTIKPPTISVADVGSINKMVATSDIGWGDLYTTSESNNSHIFSTNKNMENAGTEFQAVPTYTGLIADKAADVTNDENSYKTSPNLKHPYPGANKSLENITHGTDIPADAEGEIDPAAVRSIGMRVPTTLVGWGYDTLGRPVPASGLTLDQINVHSNLDLPRPYYGHVPFHKCNTMRGAETPSSHYAAGPLDVVWDPRKGEWKGEKFIYASINGLYKHITNGSTITRYYSWVEVVPKLILDEDAGFSTFKGVSFDIPTNFAYGLAPSENDSDLLNSNAAINIAERGTAIPSTRSVPNGTIVRLYHDIDHEYGKPFYYFNHSLLDETIPTFTVNSVKPMVSVLSGKTWQYAIGGPHETQVTNFANKYYSLNPNPVTYTFFNDFTGTYSDTTNSGLSIASAKRISYALNTLETEHNNGLTPMGISLTNLPALWARQPINEDTQVLMYADPFQLIYQHDNDLYYNITIWHFSLPNVYDGPCP